MFFFFSLSIEIKQCCFVSQLSGSYVTERRTGGVWVEKSNIPKNTLVFAHFSVRKIVSQENNISERFIFTGARIYLYKGSKEGRSDGEENW